MLSKFDINFYVNTAHYPTWASLDRDYLAIMVSSVSSEQAFSSAGITISQCQSHSKKDIVEALQCLKCMYHNNLIFWEVETVVDEEKAMDKDLEVIMDNNKVKFLEEDFFWDQLVIDIDKGSN